MVRTISVVGPALLAAAGLVGCSGTEGDLLDALNSNAPSTRLCVSPQTLGVDYFRANDGKTYFARAGDFSFSGPAGNLDALPALQKRGYASAEPVSLAAGFASYKDAWPATSKIDPYVGELDNLCIGEMQATEIIEYTEPGQNGQQITQARFNYQISFNDLVDDLDIEDALAQGPVAQRYPGTGTAVYSKTNKGWRLEMATWTGF